MAESAKTCVECGRPLEMCSGMTINGDAYHYDCWDRRGRPVPQVRPATTADQAHPSGGSNTAT
jgi:hypothetical protein